ncbi:MAG: hypothetical protein WA897_06860 [Moheibacter sp.]
MLRWQDIFDDPPDYIEIRIKENGEEETQEKTEIIDLDKLLNSSEQKEENQK